MFTTTTLTHPTLIAKIRMALRHAVMGEGEKMNGHDHRCYVANNKGHNIMRVSFNPKTKEVEILSGCTKSRGYRAITETVRSAFKVVNAAVSMVNESMAVCLDNEIACPVRMVPVQ